MQQIKDWITIVGLIIMILATLMFGGILLTGCMILVIIGFAVAIITDVGLSFFSLFRRGAKRLDGKRREE